MSRQQNQPEPMKSASIGTLTGGIALAIRPLGPGIVLPAALLLFSMLMGATAVAPHDFMEVDVAIVFAVDISSSIGPQHADLQRRGHA